MKKKIMALLATLGLAASAGAIDVNENLSINGFVDASYQDSDTAQSLGVDEVEVNFLFNAGGVSAELHVDNSTETAAGAQDNDFDVEQVFLSYTLENGLGITIGRYGSALGLEREDPGGLYTFSRAYGDNAFNLGDADSHLAEGVTLSYGSDTVHIGASFENAAGSSSDLENDDLNLELHLSYTGVENLVLGIGAFFDNGTAANETDAVNVTALYNAGKAAVGFEYTQLDSASSDRDGYLVLVDYDVNEKLGVALRYSTNESSTAGNGDYNKITIAPNYAITESLGAILEYSDIEDNDADSDQIALELTFTF